MAAFFGVITKHQKVFSGKVKTNLESYNSQNFRVAGDSSWHIGISNESRTVSGAENEEYFVCFNGLLFNRSELINKYSNNHQLQVTSTDAAFILAAYEKQPHNFFEQLDGEFVIVIINKKNQELCIISDPVGFKVCYFFETSDSIFFSSEIKTIRHLYDGSIKINQEFLIGKLLRQSSGSQTPFSGVQRLLGGRVLRVRDGQVSVDKYWRLQRVGKYSEKTIEDWLERLREIVRNAIVNRLPVEGKVGIQLSGGLDSSVVGSYLAEILKEKNLPLYSYSSVAESSSGVKDEKEYIEIFLQNFDNVIPHYESAENLNPLSDLQQAVFSLESTPNINHFMTAALFRAARRDGISSFYSGIGGDQALSYSGEGVVNELLASFKVGTALQLLNALAKTDNRPMVKVLITETLLKTKIADAIFTSMRGNVKPQVPIRFNVKRGRTKTFNKSPELLKLLEQAGILSQLLQTSDQLGTFYGVGAANPLLDKEILQFVTDMPVELYLHHGNRRGLTKAAFQAALPCEILKRDGKHMFVPDQHIRILKQIPVFFAVSQTLQSDPFFKSLLDFGMLHKMEEQVTRLIDSPPVSKSERQRLVDFAYLAVTSSAINIFLGTTE